MTAPYGGADRVQIAACLVRLAHNRTKASIRLAGCPQAHVSRGERIDDGEMHAQIIQPFEFMARRTPEAVTKGLRATFSQIRMMNLCGLKLDQRHAAPHDDVPGTRQRDRTLALHITERARDRLNRQTQIITDVSA